MVRVGRGGEAGRKARAQGHIRAGAPGPGERPGPPPHLRGVGGPLPPPRTGGATPSLLPPTGAVRISSAGCSAARTSSDDRVDTRPAPHGAIGTVVAQRNPGMSHSPVSSGSRCAAPSGSAGSWDSESGAGPSVGRWRVEAGSVRSQRTVSRRSDPPHPQPGTAPGAASRTSEVRTHTTSPVRCRRGLGLFLTGWAFRAAHQPSLCTSKPSASRSRQARAGPPRPGRDKPSGKEVASGFVEVLGEAVGGMSHKSVRQPFQARRTRPGSGAGRVLSSSRNTASRTICARSSSVVSTRGAAVRT